MTKVRREARAVAGFRAVGLHAGIKAKDPDLALIVADVPASAAAVFTQSSVVGAPVTLSRERVAAGRVRGVVVNSGCSNVAMGARGLRDARTMTRLAADAVGCAPEEMLVASTGVIGEPLPMDVLRAGIPRAGKALSATGWDSAAEAIRTTDTHAKLSSTRVKVGGRFVTIQGIAKGSGMIEPNMATMLSFIATDAPISPAVLRGMLRRVADATYNCLTIDGEGSTSDTVVLMASGAAGGPKIKAPARRRAQGGGEASGGPSSGQTKGRPAEDDGARFEAALLAVCEDLVRQLARDGEGATKLLVVEVEGAQTQKEADLAARRIGNSLLVKTAVFGADPNWGRILQTVGAGQVRWNPESTRIRVGGVVVFSKGRSAGPAARKRAEKAHAGDELSIQVDLGRGPHGARLFTCDLTYDYVKINAEYTT